MLSRRILLACTALSVPGFGLPGAARAQVARPAPHPPGRAATPGHGPHKPGEPAAPTGTPANTPLGPLDTAAKWAVILDFNTGATLLDKDADVPMPPSSMTKLMTMYIVYSLLKSGRLQLAQELPVSERAWRMGGSKMFVQIGSQVRVEDLIRGVIVQSGNDACIVFAEAIAGSEEQFADMMNQKARELGLQQTNFRNSTGWPDPEQRMSARDIANLARRLIQDFPEYYKYDSEKSFKYNNIEQQNRNPLVQKGLADGLKTGHTDDGGFGLVASAERGSRRVVLVVNGLTSMHQRAEESERLLEWSFREFEDVTLFTAGDTVEQAPVWLGAEPTVPLVGGRDLVVTMPRGWQKRAKVTLEYDSPIPAPVTRGATVGRLSVSGQGVPDLQIPLLAGADVRATQPARAGLGGARALRNGRLRLAARLRHFRGAGGRRRQRQDRRACASGSGLAGCAGRRADHPRARRHRRGPGHSRSAAVPRCAGLGAAGGIAADRRGARATCRPRHPARPRGRAGGGVGSLCRLHAGLSGRRPRSGRSSDPPRACPHHRRSLARPDGGARRRSAARARAQS